MGGYYMGVDGGATKTLAVVGDAAGRILGAGRAGPSNYQVCGLDQAMAEVQLAMARALAAAGLLPAGAVPPPGAAASPPGAATPPQEGATPPPSAATPSPASAAWPIAGAVLGLAGADFAVDFERLTAGCRRILGARPFQVVNDCWIALRGGSRRGWGVVAINGSGPNTAGVNPAGERFILRGLGYEFGNRGGAMDIIREALHRAFRAEEGIGPATALVQTLPRAVGLNSMAAVAEVLYSGRATQELGRPIVPLVFQLASAGDRVCQEILIDLGQAMGQAAGGVARRLGMAGLELEVVLAGSVWLGSNPLMRDQFTTALHREAPLAQPQLPRFAPAVGAYLMALEADGVQVGDSVYEELAATATGL